MSFSGRSDAYMKSLVAPFLPDEEFEIIALVSGPLWLIGMLKGSPDVFLGIGEHKAVVLKTDWFMRKVRRTIWEGPPETLRYRKHTRNLQLMADGIEQNAYIGFGVHRKRLMELVKPIDDK